MSIFGAYSLYYNLLYKDKDYAGEVEYVHRLLGKYRPGATSILDLGCGTGRHDIVFAGKGYVVTGVDRSEEMLTVANSNLSFAPSPPIFARGDIRTVRLDRQFDAVLSLFHVMSYQTSNEDLQAAFATACAHLGPEGIFIFDCWYGPSVLTDRPAIRVKRLEDASVSVIRLAEPVMHPNENTVDVNYTIIIKDKKSGNADELKETHTMRYLFKPEVAMMLKLAGLELIHGEEWLTGKVPGFDTWGVCFVARRAV
jgi:SAM-dependent methyltransferase